MKSIDRVAMMEAHNQAMLASSEDHVQRVDPNSLCLWYPKIADIVPTPKTGWVPFDLKWAYPIFDGGAMLQEAHEAVDRLCAMGDKIGWPCFFRTDHCSAKHDWLDTCFVPDAEAVRRNLVPLIEYGEMADLMGLPVTALVIREFLRADSPFTCYNGFPMNLERRVFVRDGEVICDHPYWPKFTVERGGPTDPDWEEKFDALYATYDDYQQGVVRDLSATVAKAIEGFWSVDFLLANGSKGYGWYLTDMALGERSFHWEGCPNGEKETRPPGTEGVAESGFVSQGEE